MTKYYIFRAIGRKVAVQSHIVYIRDITHMRIPESTITSKNNICDDHAYVLRTESMCMNL